MSRVRDPTAGPYRMYPVIMSLAHKRVAFTKRGHSADSSFRDLSIHLPSIPEIMWPSQTGRGDFVFLNRFLIWQGPRVPGTPFPDCETSPGKSPCPESTHSACLLKTLMRRTMLGKP